MHVKGKFRQHFRCQDDLHGGVCLGDEEWLHLHRVTHDRRQYHRADDEPITRNHGHNQPQRQFSADAQHDEDGNQQKLVGDRVEIGTQPGVLVELARDETVDTVRDAGDDKAGKGPVPTRLQHGQHHARHQQQAQDGD